MHALRVELLVNYVMRNVVPEEAAWPFLYWLRFEFGASGNPHAHGVNYVARNPAFETIVEDAATKKKLQADFPDDFLDAKTVVEAEQELVDFFDKYVEEKHPAKDAGGQDLYDFIVENISLPHCARPQAINLRALLDEVFAGDPEEPDLSKLRELLLALIEDGNRHTYHDFDPPTWGKHPCARKHKPKGLAEYIYCRYLFPREKLLREEALADPADPESTYVRKGEVRNDPHRSGLRNLFLERNDELINNFEAHLLLSNLGNLDWRPLINLWSVLEYLTKYTAKVGKATKHLGKLMEDVVNNVCEWVPEDGHDLWRRTIMKFYTRLLGNRDYSLFEVAHFGLRLPGVLSSFGAVDSVGISNWSSVKRGRALQFTQAHERCTNLSKLEIFNHRSSFERPSTVSEAALRDISFYAFWRLFYVNGRKLVRRKQEKFIALNGTGWPAHARRTHPQHNAYARKTLYAYMPCEGFRGTDYVDEMVREHFRGSWVNALRTFVTDSSNKWCPTWIQRNYEICNPPETATGDTLEERMKTFPPVHFEDATPAPATPLDPSEPPPDEPPSPPRPPNAEVPPVKVLRSGEPAKDVNDHLAPEAYETDHHWRAENRPAWQLHSELGPNLNPAPRREQPEAMQELVNPSTHDWHSKWRDIDLAHLRVAWDALDVDQPTYRDPTLEEATLQDDLQ